MTSDAWLVDEAITLRSAQETPMLAATLHDVVIHDNRKWFGGADTRVDTLILHGNGTPEDSESWYSPTTMRFGLVGRW